MPQFKDSQGREWSVDVTVASLKRVREALGVDLLEVLSGSLIDRLMTDPVLLVNVVYVVCQRQAESRGVTDEQFGEAMAGDAIAGATGALLEALCFFCPSPKDRENLRAVVKTAGRVMDAARDQIAARISGGDLEREARRVLDEALSGPGS